MSSRFISKNIKINDFYKLHYKRKKVYIKLGKSSCIIYCNLTPHGLSTIYNNMNTSFVDMHIYYYNNI